mmetsp:Transcript_98004/g.281937  ORF Transcript_98004/g.281937 Transcript_98004/m.281937 type:complete len:302 (+) Transcript_98004:376-1281(+)
MSPGTSEACPQGPLSTSPTAIRSVDGPLAATASALETDGAVALALTASKTALRLDSIYDGPPEVSPAAVPGASTKAINARAMSLRILAVLRPRASTRRRKRRTPEGLVSTPSTASAQQAGCGMAPHLRLASTHKAAASASRGEPTRPAPRGRACTPLSRRRPQSGALSRRAVCPPAGRTISSARAASIGRGLCATAIRCAAHFRPTTPRRPARGGRLAPAPIPYSVEVDCLATTPPTTLSGSPRRTPRSAHRAIGRRLGTTASRRRRPGARRRGHRPAPTPRLWIAYRHRTPPPTRRTSSG